VAHDYYKTLGLARDAPAAEIKAAYRKLALQFHPDRNPGDRAAEERFKEVSQAYAVLGDEDKRARYDRLGDISGDLPFGDSADLAKVTEYFDAIFGDLFGLGRKRAAGQDLRYTLELDFDEAALGCQKTIRFLRNEDCRACGGTGAQGGATGLQPCARCAGQGCVTAWLARARGRSRACAARLARAPACARASANTWCACRPGRRRAVPNGSRAKARPAGVAGRQAICT